MIIRPATDADFEAIWEIFHQVVEKGDTFAFSPASTREECYSVWMGPANKAYVAEIDGVIAGSYYIHANQPGLGDHVANAG
jgi:L-amino acid N-acyltransferase YncA